MSGSTEQIETVVIGGGHAGLTMSYYLSQYGREHLILERGRVAERWRSERWDSFCFQFPNWTLELPGFTYQGENPEEFAPGRSHRTTIDRSRVSPDSTFLSDMMLGGWIAFKT